jgi:hypothetical protein
MVGDQGRWESGRRVCELRIRDEINSSLCVDDDQLDNSGILLQPQMFFLKSGGEVAKWESRAGEFYAGSLKPVSGTEVASTCAC